MAIFATEILTATRRSSSLHLDASWTWKPVPARSASTPEQMGGLRRSFARAVGDVAEWCWMLLDCWELIQSTSEYDVACHLLYVVVDSRCIPELHCCLSVSSLHPPSVIIFFAWKGPYSCYCPSQPFLDGICLNQLNLIYFFPRQSNLIITFHH